MGYKVRSEVRDVPISLSYQEAKEYSKIFKSFDKVCYLEGVGVHEVISFLPSPMPTMATLGTPLATA